ncbi:MFS transporter [Williamsia sp. MIQD14]|uniref:MFS transporter n=1 Tax=Williamsia sp. MIQD14 TaxID=3425703 RepID=UPI003DA15802
MSETTVTPDARVRVMLLVAVMVPQLGLSLLNPSIPTMATDLGTSVSAIQLTLSGYMAGYAISMFAAGVLADRYDARRLQALGLVLFAVGGVAAALAPNVGVLFAARVVQAIGGTSATVLCRLVIQRRFPSSARMQILTSLSIVIAATPALSPLVGASLIEITSWRVLFAVLAVIGLVLAVAFARMVPSARPDVPASVGPRTVAAGIATALRRRGFGINAWVISLAWMSYFLFIEQSAYLLQDIHGLSTLDYGLVLTIPAIGYIAGSIGIRRARSHTRAHLVGSVIGGVGAAALVALATAGVGSVFALVIPLSVTFIGVGAAIPHAQNGLIGLDLPAQGVGAGLFFFIQMASGAVYTSVIEALHLRTELPIRIAIAAPALVLVAIAVGRTVRSRAATTAAATIEHRRPQRVG